MAENVNMDSFIQDTLRSIQRPRDVDFYSEQQPLVSKSTKQFTTASISDTPVSGSTGGELLFQATPYPFQVSASPTLLKSEAGLLGSVAILPQEKANPADGIHYLLAKVIINSTTGAITSSTVEWVTTIPSDTTTNYHRTIAQVFLSSGLVSSAYQFTFGPISVVIGGGFNSVWAARLL
jgi:hypothetical protein